MSILWYAENIKYLILCFQGLRMLLQDREFKWGLSVNMWRDVECTDVIYAKWFHFEVKWGEVKFLGIKVVCTLGDLILRVLDYIVTISFGYILNWFL
jgi:hypothetical protein